MRKLPEVLKRLFKASQKGRASLQAGFTLIELLVVIGILGILISAMVATIDPFEQINKGSDANSKNISAEFVNGNIRYYTTHLEFPWVTSTTDACVVPIAAGTALNSASMLDCIDNRLGPTGDSELKAGFSSVSGLDKLFVSTTGTTIKVCYKPISKSGQRDAATKYSDQIGAAAAAGFCKSSLPTAGTNDCYWCTQ